MRVYQGQAARPEATLLSRTHRGAHGVQAVRAQEERVGTKGRTDRPYELAGFQPAPAYRPERAYVACALEDGTTASSTWNADRTSRKNMLWQGAERGKGRGV